MPALLWLVLVREMVLRVACNVEGEALNAFKANLADPNGVLESWNSTGHSPCTWFFVRCNADNSVTRIDLGSANLSGQLSAGHGQLWNLQYLISGNIPEEFGNLTNLVSLQLQFNDLNGPIPPTLGRLTRLRFLGLKNNSLSGEIPMSLTGIVSLEILDLSNNQLTGEIPVNGSFSLFTPQSFSNCTYTRSFSSSLGSGTAVPGAFGIASGGVFLASIVILLIWRRRFQPRKLQDKFLSQPEDAEIHLGQLERFSFQELRAATNNFRSKNILGEGGFGKVYKGRLADGSQVAIKRLKEKWTQSTKEQFQTELLMISLAVHRNLLRLRGFCMTTTERLLVYPLMVNGSIASYVRDKFYSSSESQSPLDWTRRKRIALGVARGLAYLHDHFEPRIIHRDVKASNILLDEEFEAVIGDFGLAKLIGCEDTHVTTAVRGTIGHIAPEYFSTGKSSLKTDVFGYGIMLLELITRRRAFDLARRANEEDVLLLDWVKGLLKEKKLETLVDSDIRDAHVQDKVEELIQLALLCTRHSPANRPKMSEVVRMLESDGSAKRWDEWQQEEVAEQGLNRTIHLNTRWITEDSLSSITPDILSGPR